MKKLLAILIAMATVFSGSVAFGDVDEENKFVDIPHDGGWIGINFTDRNYRGASVIYATNYTEAETTNDIRAVMCKSGTDQACVLPDFNINFAALYSPCSSTVVINCIESLEATLPNGHTVKGVPGKLWNPEGTFRGNPEFDVPDGGQASTWTIEGTSPNTNDQYVLISGAQGGFMPPIPGVQRIDKNSGLWNLFAFLQPVKIIDGKFWSPIENVYPVGESGTSLGGGLDISAGCFMNDATQCAIRAAFDLNISYTLKIRVNHPVEPWMRGRLIDPAVSVAQEKGITTYSISGKAMKVPQVEQFIPWATAPDWLKAQYPAGTLGAGFSDGAYSTQDLSKRILEYGAGSSGADALKRFKEWIPLINDRPFAMKSEWRLQAVFDGKPTRVRLCSARVFAGIVTSNSAVYSAGAPTWNEDNQSIDYTVGAPHFDSTGNVLSGIYSLTIAKPVARCLYGFDDAPISARVEVSSEDGTPNVATTTIHENKETGMVTLTASGFHYSVPKLSVKLSQAKKVVATPKAAAPSNKKVAPLLWMTEITCVKGKIVKSVKALNPKCPTGYKKKA